MKELSTIFKTLSEPTRVRILMLLQRSPHCVCELTEILNESQPNVSKHLAKLKDLGFVDTKRKLNYIFYTLTENTSFLNHILDTLSNNLNNYPELKEDASKAPSCTLNIQRWLTLRCNCANYPVLYFRFIICRPRFCD